MSRVLEEHDYIGLSEVPTHEQTSDKPKNSAFCDQKNTKSLNFKATELRLGLPGSQSDLPYDNQQLHHDHDHQNENNINNENGFNFKVCKNNSNLVSGAKRGFSDAINRDSNNWVLAENGGSHTSSLKNGCNDDKNLKNSSVSAQAASVHASPKAQVVGWPPIRSFRKNSMASNAQKNTDNKDSKSESECLFVKVSMDGAPYLRKINLGTYGGYVELASALEKMFCGFRMGQADFTKGRLIDKLCHSEFVLTYEDKDADWMLVGDVPWNMFKDTCRRLRIMKSSDAVGLATRASEE